MNRQLLWIIAGAVFVAALAAFYIAFTMATRAPITNTPSRLLWGAYAGDETDHLRTATWYEFSEPGITPHGTIGTCRRECRLLGEATVTLYSPTEAKP